LDLQPLYLRVPDAEINWSTREAARVVAARATTLDPHSLEVRITAMRRRHLRSVLRIENAVYPRPWSLGLFMSELAIRTGRIYLVAPRRSHGGRLFRDAVQHRRRSCHDDRGGSRRGIAARSVPALLLHLLREGVAQGAKNFTLEVRMSNDGRSALYRQFGFAPAGVRKGYYVETR